MLLLRMQTHQAYVSPKRHIERIYRRLHLLQLGRRRKARPPHPSVQPVAHWYGLLKHTQNGEHVVQRVRRAQGHGGERREYPPEHTPEPAPHAAPGTPHGGHGGDGHLNRDLRLDGVRVRALVRRRRLRGGGADLVRVALLDVVPEATFSRVRTRRRSVAAGSLQSVGGREALCEQC